MITRFKVLIVLDNIHLGGISKSLLNYLPHISKIADCDLLIFNYKNLDKSLIPSNIRLIHPDDNLHILGMSQHEIKKYSLIKAGFRAILTAIARIFGGMTARKLLFRSIDAINGYDLAISFSQDVAWNTLSTGCNHFVIAKVNATFKAAFIHCDYEKFGGYDKRQVTLFQKFNKIVCVSHSCKHSFIKMFPTLESKCCVCENFTNVDEIHEKTKNEAYIYDISKINIVSVCRLGEEKGILRALTVIDRLVREGIVAFKWTIVGDGPERERIKNYIAENYLEKFVELTGSTTNPYFFMKNADLFFLPSYHEAAPMVFGECHALGLPILTTNTISAHELVENRHLGIVCENSENGIYFALRKILQSKIAPYKLSLETISQINKEAENNMQDFISSFQIEE